MGWILMAAGAFAVCGAAYDWDFFMNSRRAWLFVKLFGRNGARIFYGLLGSTLVVLGVLFVAGVIESAK